MNIVPIKVDALPARARKAISNAFAAVVSSGGFDVLSLKSKVFTKVSGDVKSIIQNDEGEPARNIEVIIVAANQHKSKVYYAGGYTEGSTDKPMCYSNNGIGPEADATEPQANKCATCAHNVIGSKISENGKKTKACADSMRLALVPGDLSDAPMLLRVPAATLKLLGEYGKFLASKGYEPQEVVTRIGFDYTVAYPALTFKAVGFVEEGSETAEKIEELRKSELVQQIIGTIPVEHDDSDSVEEKFTLPEKKAAAVAVEKPEPKVEKKVAAKPAPKVTAPDDLDNELPVAPAKKVAVEKVDMAAQVGAMVESADDLDFDD